MNIDAAGLVDEALYIASPNCDARPPGAAIELLVIHNISLPPGVFGGAAVADLFMNRLDPAAHPYFEAIAALRVSTHFFVRRDGALLQFVPCTLRAWHAGQSSWCGRECCNDYSVGIELEGTDDVVFSDAQYDRLIALARALSAHYPVTASVGHSDIAPGRKTDPGPYFDWERYRAGVQLPISR
ncbi:MAG: 1,6-anhydro-N-acetylmuramyl-L-alanine amidase AmpD [Burkholderiales bacterium]|nr:1,6-anhydro-N-acetylmuramyl-L-alanine amidase AmpD [Burkholderiales bacterium]